MFKILLVGATRKILFGVLVWWSAVRWSALSLYPLVTGFQWKRPLFNDNLFKVGLWRCVTAARALL